MKSTKRHAAQHYDLVLIVKIIKIVEVGGKTSNKRSRREGYKINHH